MVTVVTGPILSGKTTLVKFLSRWGYKQVIEWTTRPKRPGEVDGQDYNFTDDKTFDKMEENGEFAETLHVNTIKGLWKYGARKEDLQKDVILICGFSQIRQIWDSKIESAVVYLDLSKNMCAERSIARGDDFAEFSRRYEKDKDNGEEIKKRADLVLDATNLVEENAKAVDRLHAKRTGLGYRRSVNGQPVITAQEMTDGDLKLYLSDNDGMAPYLRMKGCGMPSNPINQIAWLLLNINGCCFCKVCREKPCEIKDGERCTYNIANYIRDIVHAEDAANDGKLQEDSENE